MIQILEDKCETDYYLNGEKSHRVTFKVHVDEYLKDDWKSRFQLELDETYLSEDINIFCEAFEYLKEPARAGIDLYEKKNIEFIIGSIKELILGYYQICQSDNQQGDPGIFQEVKQTSLEDGNKDTSQNRNRRNSYHSRLHGNYLLSFL